MALGYLGAEPILSVDEETAPARRLKNCWDAVVAELLVEHDWNFAIKRASLAMVEPTPEHGWDYAYQLPGDCLRVMEAKSEESIIPWTIETGGLLLSNIDSVDITYVSHVKATGRFPPGFVGALAAKLGMELALALTDSPQRFSMLQKMYEQRLSRAKRADYREDYRTDVFDESTWLEARGEDDEELVNVQV